MNRLTEVWFEFNGIQSNEMGVLMTEMPKRGLAFERGKHMSVAGRSGSVFISDGAYDNIDVSLTFDVRDGSDVPRIDAWLSGAGALRFSDEPDKAYDARISKGLSRKSVMRRFDAQRYSVTFTCHPFKRAYPEPGEITVTTSGTIITNPGTAPASPCVRIAGKGAFTVTIGTNTMWFENVENGGIVIDSELMDVLTYDGESLANDHAGGQPWTLKPGANIVSWSVDTTETSGGVQLNDITSVSILPRWRWK